MYNNYEMTAVITNEAAPESKRPRPAMLNPERDAYLQELSQWASNAGLAAAEMGLPPTIEVGYFREDRPRLFRSPERVMDGLHEGWEIASSALTTETGARYIAGIVGTKGASRWKLIAVCAMPEDTQPGGLVSVPIQSDDPSRERPFGSLGSEGRYQATSAWEALGPLSLQAVKVGLQDFCRQVKIDYPG